MTNDDNTSFDEEIVLPRKAEKRDPGNEVAEYSILHLTATEHSILHVRSKWLPPVRLNLLKCLVKILGNLR